MKRLALILALLFLAASVSDAGMVIKRRPVAGGGGGGETYLEQETFEGSADCGGVGNYCDAARDYSYGWTPRYATSPAPLEGSYSANFVDGSYLDIFYTAQDEVYYSVIINPTNLVNYKYLVKIVDSPVTTALCAISIYGGFLEVENSGGTTRESAGEVLSNGTTTYIKLRAKKGTGANAECQAYWSSSGGTGTWTAGTASTNGTWTAQPAGVWIRPEEFTSIIDDIRISASDINYP